MSENKTPTQKSISLSRRKFLNVSVTGAVAAGFASSFPIVLPARAQEGKQLRILQWSHFVPAYDKWFDAYAKAWGKENGAEVSVDHISIADLPAAIASEVSAGTGHDLLELGPVAAQFEPSLVDLADVNKEAQKRFGDILPTSKRYSYNPVTNRWFAFCHGWTIDPGDYRKNLWDKAGKGDGPVTWQDLITYGEKIFKDQSVPIGIGLSQEYDSNMAQRALLYSFGTSIQDKEAHVVLGEGEHLKRAVEAVKYMSDLFHKAMTPEVFAWNAASNNQALIAGRSSFILNSISAYRSAQRNRPDIAKDIYFTSALKGPHGDRWHCAHVVYDYVVPKFSKNVDVAKKFMLHLAENYDKAMWNSELYNSPSFFKTPIPSGDRGHPEVKDAKVLKDLHEAWFTDDPFKMKDEPDGKLKPLIDAPQWTANVGYPGTSNPATGEVWNTFIIPNMMARAVRGKESPEESVKQAAADIKRIYSSWHKRDLI
jgi:multiple sugar transport system substrate-binding protein